MSLEEFEEQFQSQYDATPSYTEVVLSLSSDDQAMIDREVASVSGSLVETQSEPVNVSALEDVTSEVSNAAQRRAAVDQAAPWAPGPLTFTTALNDGDQAVVQVSSAWSTFEGFDTANMPEEFGLEIEVNQYNDNVTPTPLGMVRPFCNSDPTTDPDNDTFRYLDDFWAARYNSNNNGVDSWSVMTELGDGIDHEDVGFYWDWVDASDECERQTMSVGIAYPQALPENSGGLQSFVTQIRAPRGWPNTSDFGAVYQTVFNNCQYEWDPLSEVVTPNPTPSTPSSFCMGLELFPPPLVPGDSFSQIVNTSRDLTVPGCYSTFVFRDETGDYSDVSPIPPMDCAVFDPA